MSHAANSRRRLPNIRRGIRGYKNPSFMGAGRKSVGGNQTSAGAGSRWGSPFPELSGYCISRGFPGKWTFAKFDFPRNSPGNADGAAMKFWGFPGKFPGWTAKFPGEEFHGVFPGERPKFPGKFGWAAKFLGCGGGVGWWGGGLEFPPVRPILSGLDVGWPRFPHGRPRFRPEIAAQSLRIKGSISPAPNPG